MTKYLTPPSLHNPKDAEAAIERLRKARQNILNQKHPFVCWALEDYKRSTVDPIVLALIRWIIKCLNGNGTVTEWLESTFPKDYARLMSSHGELFPKRVYRVRWIDAMIAELEQYTERGKKRCTPSCGASRPSGTTCSRRSIRCADCWPGRPVTLPTNGDSHDTP